MTPEVELFEAEPADAPHIAEIHLAARRQAMPYLRLHYTDAHTRDWFASVVADRQGVWWVARRGARIVGYMKLDEDHLDHLYVAPLWQGQGIGTALLNKAKALSPHLLALSTFQKNARARKFYEIHGFRPVGATDGDNQENEPDMQYVWTPASADAEVNPW
jgi:GNAT superfamily N-acetyltransferase